MTLDQEQEPTAIAPEVSVAAPLTTEQRLRAGAYSVLASLLRETPSQEFLDHLGQHSADESIVDDTSKAIKALADAAILAKQTEVDREFHDLFIGLGRGELNPYGSFYLTGFMMEKPLGVLREDLAKLGFERQQNVSESEDHVSALCEVMSMLITDGTKHADQQAFFEAHMATWFTKFFTDLQNASGASDFYRAVGQFGNALTDLETQYFSMQV